MKYNMKFPVLEHLVINKGQERIRKKDYLFVGKTIRKQKLLKTCIALPSIDFGMLLTSIYHRYSYYVEPIIICGVPAVVT